MLALPAGALAQPEPDSVRAILDPVQTPDLRLIGSLPTTCELVIAAGDLDSFRAAPAGRALERFLSEISPWERSIEAWGEVAGELDMPPAEALRHLSGSQTVYALSSQPGQGGGVSHALMAQISAATERRIREKLHPAPRGLNNSLPILAIENGAFELATAPSGRDGEARVLIAPRESGDFFDQLLPLVRGGSGVTTLAMTPAWRSIKALPEGSLLVVYRDRRAETPLEVPKGEDRFVAMTASAVGAELRAALTASEDMLTRSPHAGSAMTGWPESAVRHLSRDATLLLAGSPREQPLEVNAHLGGAEVSRTLLLTMLSMMNLPPELEQRIDGIALIAAHEPGGGADGAAGGEDALAITAAVPVPEIDSFAPEADRWGVSLAGDPALEAPRADLASIRVLQLGGGRTRLMEGLVRPGGVLAWNFVKEAGAQNGWWVMHLRTNRAEDALAASAVQALAAALAEPVNAENRTMFRLSVRPARLAELTRRARPGANLAMDGTPPKAELPPAPDPLSAFRWLDRFESYLERSPGGLLTGRVVVRMNTSLLEP